MPPLPLVGVTANPLVLLIVSVRPAVKLTDPPLPEVDPPVALAAILLAPELLIVRSLVAPLVAAVTVPPLPTVPALADNVSSPPELLIVAPFNVIVPPLLPPAAEPTPFTEMVVAAKLEKVSEPVPPLLVASRVTVPPAPETNAETLRLALDGKVIPPVPELAMLTVPPLPLVAAFRDRATLVPLAPPPPMLKAVALLVEMDKNPPFPLVGERLSPSALFKVRLRPEEKMALPPAPDVLPPTALTLTLLAPVLLSARS